MNTKNIMIVGVGGQGTLLASRLLGNALLQQGYDVKVSEVHGMSQRGGSVVTYVKYGEQVSSPIIDRGEADIVIAFELLEGARWLSYVKPGGQIILNTQSIDPMPVVTGAKDYPSDIVAKLKETQARVTPVDALKLAKEAGSAKSVNVVLMGVMASWLDFPQTVWDRAIRETVKEQFLAVNQKAFQLGLQQS